MRKRKLKIFLTPTENSIVIQSLNHLRNTMLRENRDTGCLDELLLKVMDQNFVPVTDDRDAFMGIVTRRDVLKHFYQLQKQQQAVS